MVSITLPCAPLLQVALAAACVRQNNVVWAALTAVTVALQVWAASARALGAPRLLSRAGVGALLASGPQLLPRLAPFVLLAAAAVAFVIHNGGVVVGDRSSHTAVPHLAQFGYAAGVWALYLIVFDGADIALRLACAGKHSLTPQQAAWLSCLTGWLGYSRTAAAKLDGSPARETLALADSSCTQERGSASEEDPKSDVASLAGGDRATLARQSNRDTAPRSRARAASSSRNRNLKPAAASDTAATAELAVPEQPKNSPAEHYKPSSEATKRVSLSPSMRLAVLAAVVAIVAGLVDAFTYEHEYLLSDNRHFTFYVWRRVLQPRRWLRASLAIVYVAGALLLSARIISASSLYLDEPEREAAPTRNTSASAAPAVGSGSKGTSNLASTADSAAPAGERQLVAARPPAAGVGAQAERQPCPASAIGQRSSSANDETRLQREVTALWLVCFFAASALAVVPSRLLEPRYFIMTTLIALLNTPPVSSTKYARLQSKGGCDSRDRSYRTYACSVQRNVSRVPHVRLIHASTGRMLSLTRSPAAPAGLSDCPSIDAGSTHCGECRHAVDLHLPAFHMERWLCSPLHVVRAAVLPGSVQIYCFRCDLSAGCAG